jgi:hypothetical protein
MAQQLADDLGVDAEAEQQRCGVVAQVVEADVWEPSPPLERHSGNRLTW